MDSINLAKIDSPDKFWEAIPRDIIENLQYRIKLHSYLAEDKGAQECYMNLCMAKPQIAFDSAFWTYNPFKPIRERNRPFILRPKQYEVIDALKDAIDNQHNLIMDKSRCEGATELICKMFIIYFWLAPETAFLVGSRKEDLVDRSVEFKDGMLIGPHQTLFHKVMYGIVNLPAWANINILKKNCFLQNLDNNSMIEGESTNESFGAGNRATAVLVDEIARIEPDIAQCIIDNIQETSPCCIYNSTHFKWGAGHPYAKLLRSNKIKTITLGFEDNPEKNKGLYWSPIEDLIEIKDIKYYREVCPEVFNAIDANKSFSYTNYKEKLLDLPNETYQKCKGITFIADGGEANFKRDRSVWFDIEEAKGRSKTDLAQNVLHIPQGSADMFFDEASINKLRSVYERKPDYTGEIKFDNINNKISNIRFELTGIKQNLKWWGTLCNGKPDITHNYIVACDISRGTGHSNSVMAICDVNTNELVGLYANPNIDVTSFAELAVATCKWLDSAYLIWEANGPGDTFNNRVSLLGYPRVYINVNERKITRKRTQKRGWYSTPGVNGSKMDMLSRLDAALTESLKPEKYYRYITIHDKALINELEDYIFMPGRVDIKLSNSIADESGARYAHGDRVIALGLCILAMNEARPADLKKYREPLVGSFEYRFREWKREEETSKREMRTYRF